MTDQRPTEASPIPRRFVPQPGALERIGPRLHRLPPFLVMGDDRADAVVDALEGMGRQRSSDLVDRALRRDPTAFRDNPAAGALCDLFDELDRVPYWVEPDRLERGGLAFLRTGWFGGIVLALESLVLGYCSPAGNKPLVFSGRLQENVGRRLAETSRFVQAVALPGGMDRLGDGFAITVKVRLIHARIRTALRRSPRWDHDAWCVPICQVDMAGTILLFSLLVVDGLEKLGVPLSTRDAEDLVHLWRYVGYVIGVDQSLLCDSVASARALWDAIASTQDPPDEDARMLARVLLENQLVLAKTPEEKAKAARFVSFAYGASRYLLGDAVADGLGYPRNAWPSVLKATRPVIASSLAVATRAPLAGSLGREWAVRNGIEHWRNIVDMGLGTMPATFPIPEAFRP